MGLGPEKKAPRKLSSIQSTFTSKRFPWWIRWVLLQTAKAEWRELWDNLNMWISRSWYRTDCEKNRAIGAQNRRKTARDTYTYWNTGQAKYLPSLEALLVFFWWGLLFTKLCPKTITTAVYLLSNSRIIRFEHKEVKWLLRHILPPLERTPLWMTSL